MLILKVEHASCTNDRELGLGGAVDVPPSFLACRKRVSQVPGDALEERILVVEFSSQLTLLVALDPEPLFQVPDPLTEHLHGGRRPGRRRK